jgi:5-methylcytosine-specific restriction endonuclease McrA
MPKISPIRKTNEKWCCGCKKFHLKTSFYKNSSRKDGYSSWCKNCLKKFEQSYKRKKVIYLKNDLSWWKKKVLRRKLSINPNYLFETYKKNPNCYYCKVSLKDIDVHIDHKIPLSRGGTHKDINLVLSCEDCNRLKNNKTEKEFIYFLKGYLSRFKN